MTRDELKLAIDLTADSLYRDGYRDPSQATSVRLADHLGDACPRLNRQVTQWHWARIVAGVKRELAERQYYDRLEGRYTPPPTTAPEPALTGSVEECLALMGL